MEGHLQTSNQVYSLQAYNEAKAMLMLPSIAALDAVLDMLHANVKTQLERAGIRWTASAVLNESTNKVRQVCLQLVSERDQTRGENLVLKQKVDDYEAGKITVLKEARDQQAKILHSMKESVIRERKSIAREYRAKWKSQQESLIQDVRKEYDQLNQELMEKVLQQLNQVEDSYLIACKSHHTVIDGIHSQLKNSTHDIRRRIDDDRELLSQACDLIARLDEQLSDAHARIHCLQIRINEMARDRSLDLATSSEDRCIRAIEKSGSRKVENARLRFEQKIMSVQQGHDSQLQKIEERVRGIIQKKDEEMTVMREVIAALTGQLEEMTNVAANDQ